MRGPQRLAQLHAHLTGRAASASNASRAAEGRTKLVVADAFFAPQAKADVKGIFAGEHRCESRSLHNIHR